MLAFCLPAASRISPAIRYGDPALSTNPSARWGTTSRCSSAPDSQSLNKNEVFTGDMALEHCFGPGDRGFFQSRCDAPLLELGRAELRGCCTISYLSLYGWHHSATAYRYIQPHENHRTTRGLRLRNCYSPRYCLIWVSGSKKILEVLHPGSGM